MIDCHCHLADEDFTDDIDAVVQRAQQNGVIAAVVCAEFRDQFERVVELFQQFPSFCFPAVGIHPVQVGLDFSPRFLNEADSKDEQKEVLRRQIRLAQKYNLPLNVHSRSAGRPTIELLRECGAEQVLLHAFSGNAKNAKPAIEAGYYFSIPPSFAQSDSVKD